MPGAKKPSSNAKVRRVKYLGRHLMIKGEFADMVLEGVKTTTIRVGVIKPKYDEIIIHGKGRPLAKAKIVKVTTKKLSELSDEDARRDGFSDKESLIRALTRVYGALEPDDIVTIIEFKITQRLDMLPQEDPYMGLEPADIARLALRYLRGYFDDKAIRILEDLTRTNSIRMTAIRLYGSIERRWIVRKVLRKALSILKKEGLIRAGGK
ncbi:MAG: ASCH domain-containing protein [Desulfurococcales archaeon]|nr:ASCH domain-containing protein [Desulfurococcales archaeon]